MARTPGLLRISTVITLITTLITTQLVAMNLGAGIRMIGIRRGRFALATGLVLLFASHAGAADRPQIFLLNAIVQGSVTVISAAVQGNVRSPGDVVKRFAAGSASGAGMYQAKVLTGNGHSTSGWLLANAAGSIAENAIAGRHPFAQVGYSIGPLRFRFSIPRFDRASDAHAYMDVSAFQTLALLVAIAEHDRAGFRSGMLVFKRDGFYDFTSETGALAGGATAGIFPGVAVVPGLFDDDAEIWAHETIHAIQSLQGEVLDPQVSFLTRTRMPGAGSKRFLRFGSAKVGFVNFGNTFVYANRDYEDDWHEIEAYRLAHDTLPPSLSFSSP